MLQQKPRVKEWGSPTVHDEHKERIENRLQELRRYGHDKSEWVKVGQTGSLTYYKPANTEGLKVLTCLCEGQMDCSASVLYGFIMDETLGKQLDDNVDFVKVLERIDPHNRFLYVKMKGIMYTAPRDVCTFEHWQVIHETGEILKVQYSYDHHEAPAHEDESVMVRALADGGTLVIPDPHDPNKCTIRVLVKIDVRLDAVPGWVQKMFARTAQNINATNFGAGLKQVNNMAKKVQRTKPASHIVLNHGGKLHETDDDPGNMQHQNQPQHLDDFSDLRTIDIIIALMVVATYSAAFVLVV